jgi:predicted SprT family Zn-dependent metalloprotease
MYRTKQQPTATTSRWLKASPTESRQQTEADVDIEAEIAMARANYWEAKHPGEDYPDDDIDDDEWEYVGDLPPTAITYRTFNEVYDLFNQLLFEGKLPDCLITLQRRNRSRGYFAHQNFAHRRGSEILDEIALNPKTFHERTDREIASTLVHEMTHQWQHHFGSPGRGKYHNREWADKMIALGLMPSNTGEPGGKQTGQSVTHYIVDDGPFDREWKLVEASGFKFDYQDRATNGPERIQKLKVRYTCASCEISVWGKPGLNVIWGTCQQHMEWPARENKSACSPGPRAGP